MASSRNHWKSWLFWLLRLINSLAYLRTDIYSGSLTIPVIFEQPNKKTLVIKHSTSPVASTCGARLQRCPIVNTSDEMQLEIFYFIFIMLCSHGVITVSHFRVSISALCPSCVTNTEQDYRTERCFRRPSRSWLMIIYRICNVDWSLTGKLRCMIKITSNVH